MLAALFGVIALLAGASNSGETLYRFNCSSCHGENARGSSLGPSLVGTSAVIVHFMVDTGRMPTEVPWVEQTHQASRFSEHQIDALVDYISTLTRATDRSLPKISPGDAHPGRALFAQNCEHCHGAGGEGGIVAGKYENVAPSLRDASAFQIAEAIRAGPGSMPRFGPRVLTDRDVDDVAQYIGVLKSQNIDPGGVPLSNVGPVPEGLVAWVFGLGLLVLLTRRLGTKT